MTLKVVLEQSQGNYTDLMQLTIKIVLCVN